MQNHRDTGAPVNKQNRICKKRSKEDVKCPPGGGGGWVGALPIGALPERGVFFALTVYDKERKFAVLFMLTSLH